MKVYLFAFIYIFFGVLTFCSLNKYTHTHKHTTPAHSAKLGGISPISGHLETLCSRQRGETRTELRSLPGQTAWASSLSSPPAAATPLNSYC